MKRSTPPLMTANCFSMDVEGFVESRIQKIDIPEPLRDPRREAHEIERNMDVVLQMLDELDVRGTFFVLGNVVERLPHVVRRIAETGHEVASHSYAHERLFGMDRDVFRDRLRDSRDRLEDVAGVPVYGFRAPEFSITSKTLWALEVLQDVGFVYDSSIYPSGYHNVYGIRDAEQRIHKTECGLVEFPLAVTSLFGSPLPFGGGGYYRIYPLWATRRFIHSANRNGRPVMMYLHPYEIGPEVPDIGPLPFHSRIHHYYNTGNGEKRLAKLLRRFRFAPAIDILRENGFSQEARR